jgi:hypothetical protein
MSVRLGWRRGTMAGAVPSRPSVRTCPSGSSSSVPPYLTATGPDSSRTWTRRWTWPGRPGIWGRSAMLSRAGGGWCLSTVNHRRLCTSRSVSVVRGLSPRGFRLIRCFAALGPKVANGLNHGLGLVDGRPLCPARSLSRPAGGATGWSRGQGEAPRPRWGRPATGRSAARCGGADAARCSRGSTASGRSWPLTRPR